MGGYLDGLNAEYNEKYPACHIFLNRGEKPYDTAGRYQTYEEAKEIDTMIKSYLRKTYTDFHEVDYEDRATLLNIVLDNINE